MNGAVSGVCFLGSHERCAGVLWPGYCDHGQCHCPCHVPGDES